VSVPPELGLRHLRTEVRLDIEVRLNTEARRLLHRLVQSLRRLHIEARLHMERRPHWTLFGIRGTLQVSAYASQFGAFSGNVARL